MKLFKSFRRTEKKTDKTLKNENRRKEKDARVTLIQEIIKGERYQLSDPWQLTSESLSAVVPILRRFDQDRSYLVILEISKKYISVTDSGRINKVSIKFENVKKPVFVRAGTIFKGQGTQSRTSGTGMVLEPKKENLIDVFCVHASHGISFRSGFSTMSDVVPRKVEDVLMSPQKNQAMIWNATSLKGTRPRISRCPDCGSPNLLQTYESDLICVQCGSTVPSVQRSLSVSQTRNIRGSMLHGGFTSRCYSPSSAFRDNLVGNLKEMKEFNEQVEGILSKIPADLANQVGIVIIDSKGVLGLEMFDHPDSWQAFSRSIVRNYADVIAKERAGQSLFTLRTERIPEAVQRFLGKAEKLRETTVFKNRIGETRMLKGELAGEYTTLRSNVIHMILKRKESRA